MLEKNPVVAGVVAVVSATSLYLLSRDGGRSAVDRILIRDIALTVENDADFYRQRIEPWAKNFARRKVKKTFNKKLALKGLTNNLAKEAQKTYYKLNRLGAPPTLDLETKEAIARELFDGIDDLADDFASDMRKS